MGITSSVSTLLLLCILFMGCISREDNPYKDKAPEIIKNDLSLTLDNFNSYQPIETKMSMVNLDYLGDTLIQDLTAAIKKADSVINERREVGRKAIRKYTSFVGTDENRYKVGLKWSRASSDVNRAVQEKQILVDSLSSIIKEKGRNSRKVGWRTNHVFHYKGDNNSFDDYYTYYLNNDCSQILLKICGGNNQTLHMENGDYYWSNDYVEIANRLYEEVLKRERENTK